MMMNNKLVLATVFAMSLLGTMTTTVDAARKLMKKKKSDDTIYPLAVKLLCAVGTSSCDPDTSTVVGTVKFFPPVRGVNDGLTRIEYEITGLVPNTLHGMHVHNNTIVDGEGCGSAAGHYNPKGVNHGTTLSSQRHPGDMGSVLSDDVGTAIGLLTADTPLSRGSSKIEGRSVVLHQNGDDYGLGGNDGSRANGNAGPRIACGDLYVVDP